MTNSELLELLNENDACSEARDWVNGQSAKEAWERCERPDWLFWICGALNMDRKRIVLAACACARLALKFVKEGEDRPRLCIETIERWTRNEATIAEVREARNASSDAAYAAAAYAAAAAAAAYAAAAAAAAADDDAAAAYAAAAAADAAAAAYAAARKQMHRDCADAIRKVISFEEVLALANKAIPATL